MRHLDRTIDTLKGMAPTTPPPETCPLLNQLIATGADKDLVEQVRHHNARLRNLSLYWYRVAKQLYTEGGGKDTRPPRPTNPYDMTPEELTAAGLRINSEGNVKPL